MIHIQDRFDRSSMPKGFFSESNQLIKQNSHVHQLRNVKVSLEMEHELF